MTTTETTFERETDEAIAAKYHEVTAVQNRLVLLAGSAKGQAGAKYYYRGRQRVTDMTLEEAEAILAAELEKLNAHRAAHEGEAGYWSGYAGVVAPYAQDAAQRTVDELAVKRAELTERTAELAELEKAYTGWSRFFLVTSSAGHIHSSMHCSTCRFTTTYGWLPALSGKTEADAVEAHGAALCSVCFASAPVEWVGGRITKAAAAKAVA